MNNELLKTSLLRYEGSKLYVYKDTLGLLTVGVGHLVLPADNLKEGDKITQAQADAFLEKDIENAIKTLNSLQLNLDDTRQAIVAQLCFNLGNKITQFKRFLAACRARDYATAADELQNSKWFSQVGRRGPETCFAMRTGHYGWRPVKINLP